ncbi:SLAP domain-containing protein [Clostridium sp. D46t1_190503_E9]|uniref:SLAP domain-containing protein n=1 Tax=Clostridium sp. D46t1_190503_E9 TaxID=2787137 RepID=UPI001899F6C8|nr:SLAP domain-containing protein [Clostridium sp. D46t1_190503_E9]
MSKDKSDFKLIKESNRSDFYNDLLIDEYKEVVANNSFIDNHLHINTVYLVENDYEYEVGIYITNNSDREIFLRDLPIVLRLGDKVLKEEILSLEKNISSFEAVYIEVKFDKNDFIENFDINDCDIELGDTNSLNKYNYVKINFDGLDKVREKSGYREIKRFIKNLPLIEEGSIALDVFASGEIEEGFFIIVLFRNSSSEDINIKSIPLEIYTGDDLIFYKNYFSLLDGGIKVPSYSGLFKVIVIPKDEFQGVEGEDSDTYKVKIC